MKNLSNNIFEFLGGKLVRIRIHLEIVMHGIAEGLKLKIVWHVESPFNLKE